MGQGKTYSHGNGGKGLDTKGGKTALNDTINDIISKNPLIKDLVDSGAKINVKDVVFVARDKTGMVVWLENGNESAGLKHILDGNGTTYGHAADFENAFGVPRSQVGNYIKTVISKGELVSNKKVDIGFGKTGLERIYYYDGKYHLLTAVGTNGFIVSAHPYKYKK